MPSFLSQIRLEDSLLLTLLICRLATFDPVSRSIDRLVFLGSTVMWGGSFLLPPVGKYSGEVGGFMGLSWALTV